MPAMEPTVFIEPVAPETREEFASVLRDASAWQRSIGSESWISPFDDAWMLPRIARRELFLARVQGETAGAFRLLREDRDFWGDGEVGDSLYLHTFAVLRTYAGAGVGKAIIDYVVDQGRALGREYIKLDCFSSSPRLVYYYERPGVILAGTVTVRGPSMKLMQRALRGVPGTR